MFFIGNIGNQQNFTCSLCAGHRKNRRFGTGSTHVISFGNISRQQTPPPTDLWVCHRDREDALYNKLITQIMVHLVVTKTKRFSFGL